jgi:hypothetical protein
MTTVIALAIALALTLSGAPAMAADESSVGSAPARFHAVSQIPTMACATLTPMTDDQLASIEGSSLPSLPIELSIQVDVNDDVTIIIRLVGGVPCLSLCDAPQ